MSTETTQTSELLPKLPGELPLGLKALIDAGVHFGHQTKRWNPKMRPYIYGARNGIHIIDLDQTARLFARAFHFIEKTVAQGGHILMVGTKRQAQEIIREEASRSGSSFVVNRWLGGTLTNYRTIKSGLERLRSLERMKEDGTYQSLSKKEVSRLERERERFEKYLGGLREMTGLPAAVFVIDPAKEVIAVSEANKLKIPVIAITDTNCDPDRIEFPVPGNDDAIRSIKLITARIADAVVDGSQRRKEMPQNDDRGDRAPRGPQTEVIAHRGRRRDSMAPN